MAKQGGLADNAYIKGYDLSGDVAALSAIRGGPGLLDVTAINKSAHERIGGVRDGEISFTSWFNDAAGQEHVALKGLPTADVQVLYCRGTTLGNQAAGLVAKQVNYDATRGIDGSLSLEVQALANANGLEWGKLVTAGKRTDTGATNGTGVDFGTGSTLFGLQAYLQAFSLVGTDVTVKLQESSNDGGGDPYADVTGGGFTQIVAGSPPPLAQRIATASGQTVERYIRVVTITTGGFTSLVFAVLVNRNDVSTVF